MLKKRGLRVHGGDVKGRILVKVKGRGYIINIKEKRKRTVGRSTSSWIIGQESEVGNIGKGIYLAVA